MSAKGVPREKANRVKKLQVMVTPSLAMRVESEAQNLGLSISSYLELLLGQSLATKHSRTMINEQVI